MDFKIQAPFAPAGDQPQAIEQLAQGIEKGLRTQVLLGATGTGKTSTLLLPMCASDLEKKYFFKEQAKELGYKAVIVEGNPRNYNARGFVTSADYGIYAAPSVGLPAPECLMVKELEEGALVNIKGSVEYSCYECLR